ncbi:hypothetical protein ILYODFUR_025446 [Ilyodon furcidens]|uniref:Uncharacterized protein n=1 Tax=Ilyodon furcidens TaxID=33524 RepID=A0ABV0UBA8_9TELE
MWRLRVKVLETYDNDLRFIVLCVGCHGLRNLGRTGIFIYNKLTLLRDIYGVFIRDTSDPKGNKEYHLVMFL